MSYETILYEEDGPVGTITLNRPDDGNMFTETTCHEVRDCIEAMRRETRTRVLVITGAGDVLADDEGLERACFGHGAGKPTAKIIEAVADKWAFLFDALGAEVPEL